MAQALNNLGAVARCERDAAQAAAHYAEGLELFRRLGYRQEIPRLLHNLGYLALHEGDEGRATALFRESLGLFRDLRLGRGVAEGLAGLAAVAAARGNPERAARLWGAAEALHEAGGTTIWPSDRLEYERYLPATRARLAEAAFVAARQAGRALSAEEAIAYALAESPAGTAAPSIADRPL
jgi:hypothetical protein